MPDIYDDIKHLTRPQYDDLHPMSMHDRAAQFSPFAALKYSLYNDRCETIGREAFV